MLKDRKHGQWYVEPFAGGMNMIDKVTGNRMANDANKYLIAMWRELCNGWAPVKIDRGTYNDIKTNPQHYPPYLVGWAGFNCSYSGKWFGGFAGETRTKLGTIRDYQQEAINNIEKQKKKMDGVVLTDNLYHEIDIPKNSIVYCDPPYANTTKYNSEIDHEHFWEWVRSLKKEGHTVFVSEYNAPPDFICVWEKEVKSSLSANGTGGCSKNSVERLFTL